LRRWVRFCSRRKTARAGKGDRPAAKNAVELRLRLRRGVLVGEAIRVVRIVDAICFANIPAGVFAHEFISVSGVHGLIFVSGGVGPAGGISCGCQRLPFLLPDGGGGPSSIRPSLRAWS
jgi:hypothetical protein